MHCVERHFFVNVEIIMHSFYLVLHAHIARHILGFAWERKQICFNILRTLYSTSCVHQ